MAEYIEREALREAVKNKTLTKYDWSEEIDLEDFEKVLDAIPAAEVAPVVHGRWKEISDDYEICATEFECSACKESFCTSELTDKDFRAMMRYCPNCGARMDGE